MHKKCFTNDQVKTFNQLLKLVEQCGQTIHASSQFLEYGPNDKDPDIDSNWIASTKNVPTKKQLLAQKIGELLSTIDHLVEDGVVDEHDVQVAREKKYWTNHARWKP